MLRPVSVGEQVRAVAGDPLRVLIVGAGMAGLSLAQLLRGRGLHPVLLERAPADAAAGYMLALMPIVDPLLGELGVREAYVERSQSFDHYRIRGRHGQQLQEYSMDRMVGPFGEYRGISRGALMQTLGLPGGTVSYEAIVVDLRQPAADRVEVEIDDGGGGSAGESIRAEFDLVVVADGLHSRTRDLVLPPEQVGTFDTGWGGWVTWVDADETPQTGEELWGDGFFVGTYPVQDRIGIFLGGARADTEVGPGQFVAGIRGPLSNGPDGGAPAGRLGRALDAVAALDDGRADDGRADDGRTDSRSGRDAYFWDMLDRRAGRWAIGRVVLVGDAAAGFLPTAGIGAAMAMESAWVLARHLDGVDVAAVADVLQRYERAQRPRVEAAQKNSRDLSKLLFRDKGAAIAALRDLAVRLVPLRVALGQIRGLLETRPEPAEVVDSGPR